MNEQIDLSKYQIRTDLAIDELEKEELTTLSFSFLYFTILK